MGDDYQLSTIVKDVETDSRSYSAGVSPGSSQFGVFTRNGMVKVEEETDEHETIKDCLTRFMLGTGTEANNVVAVIHENSFSEGSTSQARLERFRSASKAVAQKNHGRANVKPAWYGSSRSEICDILLNGFSHRVQAQIDAPYGVGTIHLAPLNCSIDGASCSAADENGARHILLCNVILGKTEVVSPDSKQVLPSSDKFDCGIDDSSNPRR